MAEVKVYTPEVIEDKPFPISGDQPVIESNSSSTEKKQVFAPKETQEQAFPLKMVAKELFSTAINTISKKILKTFEFAKSGALQIGEYIHGIAGEIKISPDGIVAKNKDGNTTFAIDGTTGDAIFSGDVRASTFTSDFFNVDSKGNVVARSIRFLTTESALNIDIDYPNIQTFTIGSWPGGGGALISNDNWTYMDGLEIDLNLEHESYVGFALDIEANIRQTIEQASVSTTFNVYGYEAIVEVIDGNYVKNTMPYPTLPLDIVNGPFRYGDFYIEERRSMGGQYANPGGYHGYKNRYNRFGVAKIGAGQHKFKVVLNCKNTYQAGVYEGEADILVYRSKFLSFTLGTV